MDIHDINREIEGFLIAQGALRVGPSKPIYSVGLNPERIALRVIELLYHNKPDYPQDYDTDDTITIGLWKAAIIYALTEPISE